MPNAGLLSSEAIAEGQAKKVEVTLPEGMTINPSQAEGLGVCSPAESRAETYNSGPGAGCPETAKIGNVKVDTPLLDREALGSLYVAKPYDNPFGSLLALYMVAQGSPSAGCWSSWPARSRPTRHRPDHHHLRRPAPAALLHLPTPLPRRRPGAARHPARLRQLDHQRASSALVAARPDNPAAEVVTRTSPFQIERGADGGACPDRRPAALQPEPHRRHHQQRRRLLLAPSTSASPAPTPNRSSPTSRSSCRPGSPPSSPASPSAPTRRSPRRPPAPAPTAAPKSSTTPPARLPPGRQHPGRRRRRLRPRLRPRQDLPRRPLPRRPDLLRLDHLRRRRPLRHRHRRRPPGDQGQPRNRRSLPRLDRLGPDPPHHQGRRPAPPRHPRLHRPPRVHLQPDQLRTDLDLGDGLGSGLDFVSPADDNPFVSTSPFQAADCAALPFKPKLTLKLKGSTKRAGNPALHAHLAMAGMGAAAPTNPASPTPASPCPKHSSSTTPTSAPSAPGSSSARRHRRRKMPRRLGDRQRQSRHPDPRQRRSKARSTCAPTPNATCPTSPPPCRARRSRWSPSATPTPPPGGGLRNTFEVIPDAPITSRRHRPLRRQDAA